MSLPDLPNLDVEVPSITAETLKSRLDAGEELVLLDTRPPEKHDEWRIDAAGATHVNRPWTDYLDADLTEELVADLTEELVADLTEELVADLTEELVAGLPEDDEFVVLCAVGHTSDYVAGKLRLGGYDAVVLDDGMEGWARLYELTELDVAGPTTVAQYYRPSSGCLAYLVVSGAEALVVDPLRAFTDRYVADAASYGARVTHVADTHVHADHVSGLRELAAETGAETVLSAAAARRGVAFDVDVLVEDGDTLTVGDATVTAVATPGHTSGMTAFRVGDVLLTGDGLFTDSVARPDLEEGADGAAEAARTLYDSIHERILSLPAETRVAPAHTASAAGTHADDTYTVPLGELTDRMEALRYDRGAFVEYVLGDMPPRPANYEDIIETNLGRYDVDDEEAFTLELGPNNCAAGTAD